VIEGRFLTEPAGAVAFLSRYLSRIKQAPLRKKIHVITVQPIRFPLIVFNIGRSLDEIHRFSASGMSCGCGRRLGRLWHGGLGIPVDWTNHFWVRGLGCLGHPLQSSVVTVQMGVFIRRPGRARGRSPPRVANHSPAFHCSGGLSLPSDLACALSRGAPGAGSSEHLEERQDSRAIYKLQNPFQDIMMSIGVSI
jgi:hypothetical protein